MNGLREGESKLLRFDFDNYIFVHNFYILDKKVDIDFTIHKKHSWVNRIRKFRRKINLCKLDYILNRLLPFELVKICAKYYLLNGTLIFMQIHENYS